MKWFYEVRCLILVPYNICVKAPMIPKIFNIHWLLQACSVSCKKDNSNNSKVITYKKTINYVGICLLTSDADSMGALRLKPPQRKLFYY